MKVRFLSFALFVTFGAFLSACAAPAASDPATPAVSTQAPSETTIEDPATAQPTQGPTATVWPPVFDLYSFGDIRDLDSFVVTVNEKNTVNEQLTELTNTIGYIHEPYAAYQWNEYFSGKDRTYVIEDISYTETGSGDWYISAVAGDDIFYKADIPAGNTEKLVDARFVGEEEYQGIATYHFVLEPMSSRASSEIEGDFFLARDGNYVLYSHWKETSTQGNFKQVYEVTQALSSVNQLTEITMPADMKDMVTAANLPEELDLPLPVGSALYEIIRYEVGIGVDEYYFSTPKTSIDEFLNYYRNLPTTDGWTVSHVGHVSVHENDCEFMRECVIIYNGSTQVVLYYDGATLRAEFDWPHRFSPL